MKYPISPNFDGTGTKLQSLAMHTLLKILSEKRDEWDVL